MKIFNGWALLKGFEIYCWDIRKKKTFSANSSGYSNELNRSLQNFQLFKRDKSSFLKEFLLWFFYLMIIPLVFHCLFLWRESIGSNVVSLGTLLLFISAVSLAITFLRPRFRPRAARQWHSCEHKLIHLLKKIIKKNLAEKLTVENLKKMDRIHMGCETFVHTLVAATIFMGYVITLLVPAEHLEFLFEIIQYLGAIKIILIFVGFVFLWFFVSILVQYFFLTVRPTKEQLEETVRVGKEFMKKYK